SDAPTALHAGRATRASRRLRRGGDPVRDRALRAPAPAAAGERAGLHRTKALVDFHRNSRAVTDAHEQRPPPAVEVLVHRPALVRPVSVVVDDEDAAGGQARVEMLELV